MLFMICPREWAREAQKSSVSIIDSQSDYQTNNIFFINDGFTSAGCNNSTASDKSLLYGLSKENRVSSMQQYIFEIDTGIMTQIYQVQFQTCDLASERRQKNVKEEIVIYGIMLAGAALSGLIFLLCDGLLSKGIAQSHRFFLHGTPAITCPSRLIFCNLLWFNVCKSLFPFKRNNDIVLLTVIDCRLLSVKNDHCQ